MFNNITWRLKAVKKAGNDPLNVSKGWFSEPNIEFVIEHDDEEKGILERIKYFFIQK